MRNGTYRTNTFVSSPSSSAILLVATGAAVGTLVTLFVRSARNHARDLRRLLPQTIILVRHGESEANADKSVWKILPDNLVGLTERGRQQAEAAGRRIEAIFEKDDKNGNQVCKIHLILSPFERALQTASELRKAFEYRIVRTDIESRIREQEVGNVQGDDFVKYRREQQRVGRFWYRFPTGESGADVCDRVKTWWFESVLPVNVRYGYEPIDAMVVVTHGLTMRFILMQLFGWSPTTFHSVWNAGNCEMYVLRKDLTKPGTSPYVLDSTSGDMPRSSIDIMVHLKSTGESHTLKLENYLSIPPPRTTRHELVKRMLAKQYPTEVPNADDIDSIVFMPFVEGAIIKGRSTSGVATPDSSEHAPEMDLRLCKRSTSSSSGLIDESDLDLEEIPHRFSPPPQERSLRFPCITMSGSFSSE